MTAAATITPQQQPTSAASEYQALEFFVLQRLLKMQTVTVVQVVAVYGGGLSPLGTVDVLPLVDQVDGAGNAIPHETIYGRSYVRWQGGTSAFILDPKVNDIGVMVFGSRDLSAVLSSGKHSPPSSGRIFSYSDGLYIGALPRSAPQNYVMIDDNGNIKAVTTGTYEVQAQGGINLNGATIDNSGHVTDGAGTVLHTHEHAPGTYTAPSGGGPITGNSGGPL